MHSSGASRRLFALSICAYFSGQWVMEMRVCKVWTQPQMQMATGTLASMETSISAILGENPGICGSFLHSTVTDSVNDKSSCFSA
ncbi:unnamed protein product [Protopolystoma xenopodis]|uniref:Secreted protein n=1 Tax=Protopolystoma xenopodis TaxID=117903 RepID=A0A3S5AC61_9PLAT|nr:unnamed protein product [Protopolystoma xenopodis]